MKPWQNSSLARLPLPDAARVPLAELLVTARSSGRAAEIRLRAAAQGPTWDVSATPFTVGERQQLLVRVRDHDAGEGGDAVPAMMRSLVESTPDAVVITDSAGHVQLANPAFVALVQQGSEARVKGQGLADLVGDRSGAWRDTIARTRLQGLGTQAFKDGAGVGQLGRGLGKIAGARGPQSPFDPLHGGGPDGLGEVRGAGLVIGVVDGVDPRRVGRGRVAQPAVGAVGHDPTPPSRLSRPLGRI